MKSGAPARGLLPETHEQKSAFTRLLSVVLRTQSSLIREHGSARFGADDQRPDRIVARAPAGIADDMRVTFPQARIFRRIEPSGSG